jgi:aspartyl-tRNA synthetase
MGWVQKRRDLGGVIFIDLRDRSGYFRLYLTLKKRGNVKKAESIRNEYVLVQLAKW